MGAKCSRIGQIDMILCRVFWPAVDGFFQEVSGGFSVVLVGHGGWGVKVEAGRTN